MYQANDGKWYPSTSPFPFPSFLIELTKQGKRCHKDGSRDPMGDTQDQMVLHNNSSTAVDSRGPITSGSFDNPNRAD